VASYPTFPALIRRHLRGTMDDYSPLELPSRLRRYRMRRKLTSGATDIVEHFFSHLTAREWNELGTILDQEVLRIGPFGDQLTGRQVYLDFLSLQLNLSQPCSRSLRA
jgi:hypothetical protein